LAAAEKSALQLGVKLHSIAVATPDALLGALDAAVKGRAEALVTATAPFLSGPRLQIAALAVKYRLPSLLGLAACADAGGLLTYGPNDSADYRQAAVFVDKICRRAKPGDLPVEQPTRFEPVMNRKTAKELGLTIPQPLLLRADEVIQ
jgi:putative ABC transport system substrate-binding protein